MLQYTFELAERIENKNEDQHAVTRSIIDAAESGNPDNIKGLIPGIGAQLFDDAGVAYARISRRGEQYSIADEAYNKFASWFDYPWD